MVEEIETRSFWVRGPGAGAIVVGSCPEPGEDEVLVEASYSGISRGTESLVFRGDVPPSQYHTMRAPFQEGEFPGPLKYGYSSVGRVARAGGGAEELLGRAVFCLHPHQDRYVVPASAVVPLPLDVPEARAVLAANLETAVNVVWDAHISVGDRVVVVGAGVVGLLVGWLCARIPATDVLLVDVNGARKEPANALGIRFAPAVAAGHDADVVVHASGHPSGARAALAAAGQEARVIEASWFGRQEVSLPLGEAFHARRLTLRSSQVGRIPPERTPRWTHRRRMETALGLLRANELDVLISGEDPFERLPAVMAHLSGPGADALCHRVRYGTSAGPPV
jgi:2-desacetyl-2-hydroxyethyl bacteriochlorophyllide A dehydrogenase